MAHAANLTANAERHFKMYYQVKDLLTSGLPDAPQIGNDYEDWGADCSSYAVWTESPEWYVDDNDGVVPGVPLNKDRRAFYKEHGFGFKKDGTVTYEGVPVAQWIEEHQPAPEPKATVSREVIEAAYAEAAAAPQAPAQEPAAPTAAPAAARPSNSPKQRAENLADSYGATLEDTSDARATHLCVTAPVGTVLTASGCHSIVVHLPAVEGSKRRAWGELVRQLRLGTAECAEPNCGMCERGAANV